MTSGQGDLLTFRNKGQEHGAKKWLCRGKMHGGLMDRRMWDDQFTVFAQKYRVLRYDIRGYGNSDAPSGQFSHVEDLYSVLESLDIERAYVVGLSLGGMIALDFTLEDPDMVDALIAVASGLNGYRYADAEDLASKFQAIRVAAKEEGTEKAVDLLMELPYFVPVSGRPEIREKMRTMAKENYNAWSAPQDIQAWPSPPSAERLSEIDAPTLIVVGDHDVSDIFGVADTLEAGISKATKIVIQDAGHHVNMEKPEEVNHLVLDFLSSFNSVRLKVE
ncbi:hypothetical protein AMJ40_07590 [candidate division TA06 bacterium DG_26]|uniref:AB hydrolase-1 domain-containing protein n=1 Tax=candidate division TA06 bacterium DG_26 TaxID=1703771 RepID=A0A0S7WFG1_UNCT6|nr:MAG: hypothetical protein AMJ40_07590 [candidate division TA06 bacterium DG_26]